MTQVAQLPGARRSVASLRRHTAVSRHLDRAGASLRAIIANCEDGAFSLSPIDIVELVGIAMTEIDGVRHHVLEA